MLRDDISYIAIVPYMIVRFIHLKLDVSSSPQDEVFLRFVLIRMTPLFILVNQ
jgi:hypothetical protein